jgi:excisionase family DNA binding protein
MPRNSPSPLVSVDEAGRVLGISLSTVWRLIRHGSLPSIRKGGRRFIPKTALVARAVQRQKQVIPPLTRDHPIFRLVGAGRGGGTMPGARDKHAVLDE